MSLDLPSLPSPTATPSPGRGFVASGTPRGAFGVAGSATSAFGPGTLGRMPAPAPADGLWVAREGTAMATRIRVELWHPQADVAQRAAGAVLDEMRRIEATLSPFRDDSALAEVNREAQRRAVPVDDELFMLLARAAAFAADSDGAFDVTFAAAGRLYDFRRGVRPDGERLAQARAAVGWRHLLLDERARTVRFGRPGMRIDLGGFAKGHAVDNATAIVRRLGVAHAWIAAGGDSRVIGDRRGRPWTVGIRDPRRADGLVAVLPLSDVAVSTSGDYERCFEVDGQRVHHVMDPRTGEPAGDVRSVTIVVPAGPHAGLTAEALSKTVFVLGAARGLAHIERLQGVDAIVVDAAGHLHHSSGLLGARATAAAGIR